jgi:hypothetical protein
MAKLTYLQLVNRVIKRITQPEVTTLVGITGQGKIISELINEAQSELWTETTNWYSLFTERTFYTFTWPPSGGTGKTLTYANTSPATITDSASGFAKFVTSSNIGMGQTIKIQGSTYNDGVYILSPTVAPTASVLTLQAADSFPTAGADTAVTAIYPITYPVTSDFGRTYHIADMTNNRILTEDTSRSMTTEDPQMQQYNEPTHFAMEGNFYRFYYISQTGYQLVDRYWKVPTTLSADSDTYVLPLFCENFLIQWSLMRVLEYMNKFDAADRIKLGIYTPNEGVLEKAKIANQRVIDRMLRFQPTGRPGALTPPRFSEHYGARYY